MSDHEMASKTILRRSPLMGRGGAGRDWAFSAPIYGVAFVNVDVGYLQRRRAR